MKQEQESGQERRQAVQEETAQWLRCGMEMAERGLALVGTENFQAWVRKDDR